MMRGNEIGEVKDETRYPKLMVNENIIAIFSDAENAVCVSRLCETAVDVGQKLARGSFGPHDFEDYHGVVRISNV